MRNLKSILKLLSPLSVIWLAIFYFQVNAKKAKKSLVDLGLNSVVVEKYKTNNSNKVYTLKFKDSTIWDLPTISLNDSIDIGDSVVKKVGVFKISVYRKLVLVNEFEFKGLGIAEGQQRK